MEIFCNENDMLNCWFSEKVQRYILEFNAKIIGSFRTKKSFDVNKFKLIEKYKLTHNLKQ